MKRLERLIERAKSITEAEQVILKDKGKVIWTGSLEDFFKDNSDMGKDTAKQIRQDIEDDGRANIDSGAGGTFTLELK